MIAYRSASCPAFTRIRAYAAALLLATAAGAWPAASQEPLPPNPDVAIAYQPPTDAKFDAIYERLKERRMLERLAVFLAPLKLPRTLKIQAEQCGQLTRPFTRQRGISLCYEYFDRIVRAATEAVKGEPSAEREKKFNAVVTGASMYNGVYRIALAVLDIYDTPIWGRFTDAADRLTAFLLLQFGPDIARLSMTGLGIVLPFNEDEMKSADFAKVSSPGLQRAFNYFCMAHGFDEVQRISRPELDGGPAIAGFVPGEVLPVNSQGQGRADRCIAEYVQGSNAFFATIWPHIDQRKADILRRSILLRPGDL